MGFVDGDENTKHQQIFVSTEVNRHLDKGKKHSTDLWRDIQVVGENTSVSVELFLFVLHIDGLKLQLHDHRHMFELKPAARCVSTSGTSRSTFFPPG